MWASHRAMKEDVGKVGIEGELGIVGVCDFLGKEPRTGDTLPNLSKQH